MYLFDLFVIKNKEVNELTESSIATSSMLIVSKRNDNLFFLDGRNKESYINIKTGKVVDSVILTQIGRFC